MTAWWLTLALGFGLQAPPIMADLPVLSQPQQYASFRLFRRPVIIKPLDWTPGFTMVWLLDEASGDRVDAEGTGTHNMTDPGGGRAPDNDTTNKKEGLAAANFDDTNDEYLLVTDANSGEADFNAANTDASWGCWSRPTNAGKTNAYILTNGDVANNSWSLRWSDIVSIGQTFCAIDASTIAIAGVDTTPENEYHHVACVWDTSGTQTMRTFLDGAAGATLTPSTGGCCTNSFDLELSNSTTNIDFDGQLDECFYVEGVELVAAELCRICSCDINGQTGPCVCGDDPTSTTYANPGRNATDCGDCTLPACNAGVPS